MLNRIGITLVILSFVTILLYGLYYLLVSFGMDGLVIGIAAAMFFAGAFLLLFFDNDENEK